MNIIKQIDTITWTYTRITILDSIGVYAQPGQESQITRRTWHFLEFTNRDGNMDPWVKYF